jgi:threonine/homoserine/homoserine lactone efflux protein
VQLREHGLVEDCSRGRFRGSMAGLVAFLGVALVVIVTPGQDTALTVRNTLAGGRRAGVRTAAGVVCGQAVWALAASAGVAALLVASEPAFVALKVAGAAYLTYLGATALLAAARRRPQADPAARPAGGHELRQGLLGNLGNPKMAVFFSSLLPQFGDSFAALLGLGLLFCSLTLLWLCGYAVTVARAGDLLRRPRVRRSIDALTGTALVALGVRLATTHR